MQRGDTRAFLTPNADIEARRSQMARERWRWTPRDNDARARYWPRHPPNMDWIDLIDLRSEAHVDRRALDLQAKTPEVAPWLMYMDLFLQDWSAQNYDKKILNLLREPRLSGGRMYKTSTIQYTLAEVRPSLAPSLEWTEIVDLKADR